MHGPDAAADDHRAFDDRRRIGPAAVGVVSRSDSETRQRSGNRNENRDQDQGGIIDGGHDCSFAGMH